jgi:pilus assembly protein CpaB
MNTQKIIASVIGPIRRHKIAALFACALATGLVSAWGIRSQVGEFLAAERAKLVPKVKTIEVVVAKRNLKPGEIVSGDTMAVRPVPLEFVASNAIRPDKFDGFVGAKLSHSLQAGETLVSASLAGADIATFSSKVKLGIRAMTVAVDEVNSVSGMLQPGDHIDLLLSVKPPPSVLGASAIPGPEITAPLLQDILVLATGKQVRPGQGDDLSNRSFNAITVEVSPEQAQKLVVAQRGGKLTAMLRNPGDHQELSKQALDIYSLLGIRPPLPSPVLPVPTPVQVHAPAQPVQLPPVQQALAPLMPPASPQVQAATPAGAEIIVGGRGPIARPSSLNGAVPVGRNLSAPLPQASLPQVPIPSAPINEEVEFSAPSSPTTPTAQPITVPKAPLAAGQVSQNSLPQSLIEVR